MLSVHCKHEVEEVVDNVSIEVLRRCSPAFEMLVRNDRVLTLTGTANALRVTVAFYEHSSASNYPLDLWSLVAVDENLLQNLMEIYLFSHLYQIEPLYQATLRSLETIPDDCLPLVAPSVPDLLRHCFSAFDQVFDHELLASLNKLASRCRPFMVFADKLVGDQWFALLARQASSAALFSLGIKRRHNTLNSELTTLPALCSNNLVLYRRNWSLASGVFGCGFQRLSFKIYEKADIDVKNSTFYPNGCIEQSVVVKNRLVAVHAFRPPPDSFSTASLPSTPSELHSFTTLFDPIIHMPTFCATKLFNDVDAFVSYSSDMLNITLASGCVEWTQPVERVKRIEEGSDSSTMKCAQWRQMHDEAHFFAIFDAYLLDKLLDSLPVSTKTIIMGWQCINQALEIYTDVQHNPFILLRPLQLTRSDMTGWVSKFTISKAVFEEFVFQGKRDDKTVEFGVHANGLMTWCFRRWYKEEKGSTYHSLYFFNCKSGVLEELFQPNEK